MPIHFSKKTIGKLNTLSFNLFEIKELVANKIKGEKNLLTAMLNQIWHEGTQRTFDTSTGI